MNDSRWVRKAGPALAEFQQPLLQPLLMSLSDKETKQSTSFVAVGVFK
jgi:hypothetical protein